VSKMRIGFDASVLGSGTRYTGTGQYAVKLLEHLPMASRDDELLIYTVEGSGAPIPQAPNVRERTMKPIPFGKLSALATHLLSFPRIMRRDNLDVLHVPAVHTRPSLPPVPRSAPCPKVVTLHDLIPITFYGRLGDAMPWRMRRYYKWNLAAAARADHIITVSATSREEIIKNLDVPPDRLTAIHNGIDLDAWSQARNQDTSPYRGARPYVLFGGSYEPRKNVRGLLDAYELAVDMGLTHDLVMVVDAGSGYESDIRRHAATLNSRNSLHFLSGLEDAELISLYQGADAFVFPSLSEGFGFPPLQAMACGVPVVASDLPVLREVLGEAAVFVDPHDSNAIAEAMNTVVSDGQLADRLVGAGRTQAAKYSWDEAARRTVEALRAVGEGSA
jgi:glycosyltransferase involved in cell wall biosynthesis